MTGIAWPFGSPDSVGDVIEKGTVAFANSVPMVMEHDQQKVVGIWESCTETDSGLEVKGRLFVEGIGPARDAHRQLKAGKIGGLSIGFRHTGFEPRAEGGRVFKSITVNEISLCRFPVHPGAHVTVVKSQLKEELMENEEMQNNPETKSDPVVSADELKAIKARMDKLEAKANRPLAANNNHPAGQNDNDERKAFVSYLRRGIERISPEEVKALTVSDVGKRRIPGTGRVQQRAYQAPQRIFADPQLRPRHLDFRPGDHLSAPRVRHCRNVGR
ncbi:MAG: HK97 family phage prohead protease [Rhizobium sp.]|nr:HK97 family phage prohead protease [Rhizobium sp.]